MTYNIYIMALSDSFPDFDEWAYGLPPSPIHFPLSGNEVDQALVRSVYSRTGYEFSDFAYASEKLTLIRRLSPSPECILFERRRQIETVKQFSDFVRGAFLADESWVCYPEQRKVEWVQQFLNIHSQVCGMRPGDVIPDDTYGQNGQYRSGNLYINMKRGFVDVIGTAVHENTHNHQDQIRHDDRDLNGPLKSLIEILRVTWDRTELDLHYLDKPREVHARDWQYTTEDGLKVALGLMPKSDFDYNREYPTQYRTKAFPSEEQGKQDIGFHF